jgi:cysteine-rich repeat protein
MLAVLTISVATAQAQHAPDDHSVLILGSTVGCANPSLETTRAMAQGWTVVVDTDAQWLARTTADFATFQAIILGDKACVGTRDGNYAAAEANRAVWSPAIKGNIVLVGTDPTYHSSFGPGGPLGGDQVVDSAIAFATADDGNTGAYISLSFYLESAPPSTPVVALDQLGSFTVTGTVTPGVGCFFAGTPEINDAHIVATHPALAGLTDVSLSNWNCSVHEVFNSFPADFLPLVVAENVGCPSPPGTGLNFGDGSCGTPYVLARGKELVPLGCGDGIVNPGIGEECDDGNTNNGDGCSAQCKIVPTNLPPDCTGAGPTIGLLWPPNHKNRPFEVGIGGVTDPDGDPVTITITSIMQDEPVNTFGDGTTLPCDAMGVGGPTARIRVERSGTKKVPGNGRFYHIFFTGDDGAGGRCSGKVRVAVPHDQAKAPIDDGPLYNSCTP